FFLIFLQPPRSTLFPYTTLFRSKFYKNLPAIRDRIFNGLMAHRYFLHRPDTVRQGYLGAGLVIGLLMVWGGSFLGRLLGIAPLTDRKSTRLNSSHVAISYAVFCL